MDDQPDADAIGWVVMARVLAGEGSADDVAAIERWADAMPEGHERLATLRTAWDRAALLPDANRLNTLWTRIWDRLDAPAVRPPVRVVAPQSTVRRWYERVVGRRAALPVAVASVAAACLVVLGGTVVWHAQTADRSGRDAQTGRAYVTKPGQRETVTLRDGTQITLAPASRVALAADYGVHGRAITLEGEALFMVAHDAERPFVVQAAQAVASDVGTSFDVRSYPGDSAVQVVVADGQVAVRGTQDSALRSPSAHLLRAGDLVLVSGSGGVGATRHVDVDRYLTWTAGHLAFEDTPLPVVAVEMSRWYGVDIEVADPALRTRDVTITFMRQPLSTALQGLASITGARVERRGDTYTLYSMTGLTHP